MISTTVEIIKVLITVPYALNTSESTTVEIIKVLITLWTTNTMNHIYNSRNY